MEEKLTCHLCNSPLDLDDYDLAKAVPQLMKEKQLCFRCAFWHRIIESDKTLIEDSNYVRNDSLGHTLFSTLYHSLK